MVKKYLKLLKQKIYLAVLMVCACAMLGSLGGARKESKELISIYGPVLGDGPVLQNSEKSLPELAGYLPLAADQNRWYNFQYAIIFAGAGVLLYCILMAGYLPLYCLPFFVKIREKLVLGSGKSHLFIHLK